MKLIKAIIYVRKNKNKPIGEIITLPNGSSTIKDKQTAYQQFLCYNNAMNIIYGHKYTYLVLKFFKVI